MICGLDVAEDFNPDCAHVGAERNSKSAKMDFVRYMAVCFFSGQLLLDLAPELLSWQQASLVTNQVAQSNSCPSLRIRGDP